MRQRLTNWLRRLFDRVRYPGQSVQYELHRMTHKGGWKNFYSLSDPDVTDAFPTPPPQPSFGPDTGWSRGKYRCLRRVNGRIESTLWTVESPNADDYYAELRERAAAEAAKPSVDEVKANLEDGSYDKLLERIEWHEEHQSSS